ncbi:MAG: hypothetical protein HUU55_16250 [Myxococcales bacterium]|nr:hypothetical protein [Myxococcales bacterium]
MPICLCTPSNGCESSSFGVGRLHGFPAVDLISVALAAAAYLADELVCTLDRPNSEGHSGNACDLRVWC